LEEHFHRVVTFSIMLQACKAILLGAAVGAGFNIITEVVDFPKFKARTLAFRIHPHSENFDADVEVAEAFYLLDPYRPNDEQAFDEAVAHADNILFIGKRYRQGRPKDMDIDHEMEFVDDLFRRCHEELVKLETATYQTEIQLHREREIALKMYHQELTDYQKRYADLETEKETILFDGSSEAIDAIDAINQKQAQLKLPKPGKESRLKSDYVHDLIVRIDLRLGKFVDFISNSITLFATEEAQQEVRNRARLSRRPNQDTSPPPPPPSLSQLPPTSGKNAPKK